MMRSKKQLNVNGNPTNRSNLNSRGHKTDRTLRDEMKYIPQRIQNELDTRVVLDG